MHEATAMLVIVATASLKVFGDTATDPGFGTVATWIGNVGTPVVLAWFLYYTTTKSQPDMLKKFSDEQEKSRRAFGIEQADSRKAFLQEQSLLREHHSRETAELRAMLIQTLQESSRTMQAMRTAVHDVRDTAHAVVVKAAVAAEKATGSGVLVKSGEQVG